MHSTHTKAIQDTLCEKKTLEASQTADPVHKNPETCRCHSPSCKAKPCGTGYLLVKSATSFRSTDTKAIQGTLCEKKTLEAALNRRPCLQKHRDLTLPQPVPQGKALRGGLLACQKCNFFSFYRYKSNSRHFMRKKDPRSRLNRRPCLQKHRDLTLPQPVPQGKALRDGLSSTKKAHLFAFYTYKSNSRHFMRKKDPRSQPNRRPCPQKPRDLTLPQPVPQGKALRDGLLACQKCNFFSFYRYKAIQDTLCEKKTLEASQTADPVHKNPET